VSDPFLTHLVALLSVYELGHPKTPVPRWYPAEQNTSWEQDAILRSLGVIGKRL
ncbi:hypothetical protein C8J56DRAFT_710342, partial [Mycena floridula]